MAQFTFLSQLKLRNKFLVLSVIGLLIASVPTVLVLRSASRDLAVFKAERSGMAPVATALNALQLLKIVYCFMWNWRAAERVDANC